MTFAQPLRPLLLVEDNPDDEALTLRALRRGRLANPIRIARDGQEALEILGAMEPLPCVILLDLKLPKLSGLQVLRQIRAADQTRLLPVVILTSSNQDQDIRESYALGANSYVAKPVEIKKFTEAVQQLGIYWALVNESYLDGF